MITQCCKCRLYQHQGQWVGRAPEANATVSHTYCPHCKEEALLEIKRERIARHPELRTA
jgi:hypothetical protein